MRLGTSLGALVAIGLAGQTEAYQNQVNGYNTCPAPSTIFITVTPYPVVVYQTVYQPRLPQPTPLIPVGGNGNGGYPVPTATVTIDSYVPPAGGSQYGGPKPWLSQPVNLPSSPAQNAGSSNPGPAANGGPQLPQHPSGGYGNGAPGSSGGSNTGNGQPGVAASGPGNGGQAGGQNPQSYGSYSNYGSYGNTNGQPGTGSNTGNGSPNGAGNGGNAPSGALNYGPVPAPSPKPSDGQNLGTPGNANPGGSGQVNNGYGNGGNTGSGSPNYGSNGPLSSNPTNGQSGPISSSGLGNPNQGQSNPSGFGQGNTGSGNQGSALPPKLFSTTCTQTGTNGQPTSAANGSGGDSAAGVVGVMPIPSTQGTGNPQSGGNGTPGQNAGNQQYGSNSTPSQGGSNLQDGVVIIMPIPSSVPGSSASGQNPSASPNGGSTPDQNPGTSPNGGNAAGNPLYGGGPTSGHAGGMPGDTVVVVLPVPNQNGGNLNQGQNPASSQDGGSYLPNQAPGNQQNGGNSGLGAPGNSQDGVVVVMPIQTQPNASKLSQTVAATAIPFPVASPGDMDPGYNSGANPNQGPGGNSGPGGNPRYNPDPGTGNGRAGGSGPGTPSGGASGDASGDPVLPSGYDSGKPGSGINSGAGGTNGGTNGGEGVDPNARSSFGITGSLAPTVITIWPTRSEAARASSNQAQTTSCSTTNLAVPNGGSRAGGIPTSGRSYVMSSMAVGSSTCSTTGAAFSSTTPFVSATANLNSNPLQFSFPQTPTPVPVQKRHWRRQANTTSAAATSEPTANTNGTSATASARWPTGSTSTSMNTSPLSSAVLSTKPPSSSSSPSSTSTLAPATTSSNALWNTSSASSTQASTGTATSPPSAFCSGVAAVGNMTLDFDDFPSGPLYNPYRHFWFSEGFMVNPDSPPAQYNASSGAKLVTFIPASLSNGRFNNSHDMAMISMGKQDANPCFRFDLHELSFGCDSRTQFQDCHFTVVGMRYNATTGTHEPMGASEDAMTLACTGSTPCKLTPKTFTGYTNLSSVIIFAKADGQSRVWWADDLRVGWTDNSCDQAACRATVPEHMARRGMNLMRREVWQWNVDGMRRLHGVEG